MVADTVRIDRIWAMPNRWTFTILPIKNLLIDEVCGGLWVDPFAGENSPATITNDLNPERPTTHHMDALEFLKSLDSDIADGALYDPPYSLRQASECYKSFGKEQFTSTVTSAKYWADCKDQIQRILKHGGKAICFGWNSNGIGMKRGFKMERMLVVPHGGSKNDTIITVETKTTQTLF